jgi:hypothetical protein
MNMNTISHKLILNENYFIKITNKIEKDAIFASIYSVVDETMLFGLLFANEVTFSEIKKWGLNRLGLK